MHDSIKSLLKRERRLQLTLVIVPIVFIIGNLFFVQSYIRSVDNIVKANDVSERIGTRTIDELWLLVHQQITISDFKADNNIIKVREQLEKLKQKSKTSHEVMTLNIALRLTTMLEKQSNEIIENLKAEAPVATNFELMNSIKNTVEITDDTIENFIGIEIGLSKSRSDNSKRLVVVFLIFESGLLLFNSYAIKKNNRLMVNEIENPINDLKKMSDALAQNHLEYRIQNYPQNELGKLSESMNTMAEQLNVLMAENALKQYNLAQSELRTLQSQITPHFIYNSLDAIISLASLGELDLVQKMTYALSDFFRISLSKGRDFIFVEKEIQHITDYLTILKIRYGETLDYKIEIDSTLYHYQMLKIILQPIVENAIYHGTKLVRRTGMIEISGELITNNMHFYVKDNGKGIEKEHLAKLNHDLANGLSSEFNEGYGLFNVNKRLLLYYDNKAKITLDSTYEVGTIVHIVIPTNCIEDERH